MFHHGSLLPQQPNIVKLLMHCYRRSQTMRLQTQSSGSHQSIALKLIDKIGYYKAPNRIWHHKYLRNIFSDLITLENEDCFASWRLLMDFGLTVTKIISEFIDHLPFFKISVLWFPLSFSVSYYVAHKVSVFTSVFESGIGLPIKMNWVLLGSEEDLLTSSMSLWSTMSRVTLNHGCSLCGPGVGICLRVINTLMREYLCIR